MSVNFYNKSDPFYEFSNFFPCKIIYLNKKWSSSEQLFQAMKFYIPESPLHMEYFDIISQADSPMKVFALGLQKKQSGYGSKWVINKNSYKSNLNEVIHKYKDVTIRKDWDANRLDVMKTVLENKFQQNINLQNLLLSTGDMNIIEDSPRDNFWGIGKDGKGHNHLGKILVQLREQLKAFGVKKQKETKAATTKAKKASSTTSDKPKAKNTDKKITGKILNPATNRYVKIDGKIGKSIINQPDVIK
jgi:predicted NAD-dependent protein-ADP-ribosyltransferase YbiA (DUF1768 family)